MIINTKQNWSIGNIVKVGFMKLEVVAVEAIKDGMPDIYTLKSSNGKMYEFIPHNGLIAIN